ncbi:uncharacterized protein A4U43_C01F16570 [Asparagus officinalis]|uniref:Uncharacterized protein n=1 Tax=Asparagus officinalis TaxID=4686 RepID=A0A5P1FPU9_ASPOF|nr:uncharacterized protein A4U43_C01F16570 [Asparagus officinalis]
MVPPIGLEYPYPHRVADIGEEEWERMRQYLVRSSRVGPRFVQEPNLEHRYQPAHHIDVKGRSLSFEGSSTFGLGEVNKQQGCVGEGGAGALELVGAGAEELCPSLRVGMDLRQLSLWWLDEDSDSGSHRGRREGREGSGVGVDGGQGSVRGWLGRTVRRRLVVRRGGGQSVREAAGVRGGCLGVLKGDGGSQAG